MEIDELYSSEFQEQNKVDNNQSAVDSYLSQNIIGHDWFWNSEEKIGYKPEEYSDEDATMLLDQYNMSLSDRSDILSSGKSIQHIYDMAEDKKRNNQQMELIQSHGAVGIATSIGTSIFDLPSWVIGMGYGKVAGMGINAYKLGRTGTRFAQAGAGAATAVTSVAALEATLGNELTTEQAMINGALGFGLGYTFAGLGAKTPEGMVNAQKLTDGSSPIEMTNKKESFLLPFLHSASDRLKTSDNPSAVELGYTLTRSMGDVGIQNKDTVNDVLRETKAYLTKAKEDFAGFADEFEKQTGRKLTPEDEVTINKIGHTLDHEYNMVKDSAMESMKKSEINKQIGQVDTDYKVKQSELKTKAKEEIAIIEKDRANYTPEVMPEKKIGIDKKTGKTIETARSKISRQAVSKRNNKAKRKFNRAIDKRINDVNKNLESGLKSINKESISLKKNISKSEFSDESLALFNQRAIKEGQIKLQYMLKSTDAKYKKAIEIMREFKAKHAAQLKQHDVDGLKDIDDTFHWSRQYDADRIANDITGAKKAFERAISANFDKMTKELETAIAQEANNIVNKILASKASFETIDLDVSHMSNALKDKKLTQTINNNLKGRKFRLNGAELTNYMSNDIVGNMTGYSRTVGGRIATKRALGIDKNFKASEFADMNNLNAKDRELFKTALDQAQGKFAIDPHMNSVTSKMVRALTGVNYINFGGWFGANTLSDISNIAYDFGLGRTTKYMTKDIVSAIKKDPNGKKLARYLGYASESLTNDRALLYGADEFAPSKTYTGEKLISKGGALVSKASGMNMVVDMMDRVTSFASLDYILKGAKDDKFIKTMNRLGLDMKSVNKLRNNKEFVKWESGAIKDIDFDVLDTALKADVERGLRRAISDVVLKGGDLDAPEFLTRVLGSHALAKALFQFMRFPAIAYNKLGRKMLHNFDAIDGMVATATGAAVLGLTTQMKDIGKEKPRYDLDTKEGQINSIKYIIERMPHLAFVGLVQSQADIIGRVASQAADEEYRGYGGGIEMGVTIGRLNDVSEAMGRFMNGDVSSRDIRTLKSFASTNLFWLQPLNNIVDDQIKEEFK